MDSRRLTKERVEQRLNSIAGIPYDYMLSDKDPPYIAWNFVRALITASDDGIHRVRQDTIMIRLYQAEYSQTNVDKVANAFSDFEIDMSEDYISAEQLYETTFTITHTGKIKTEVNQWTELH